MNNAQHFWTSDVTFGEIVYPPGGHFGPRHQRHLQLVFVYRGSMTVWIDDERHDAAAGTASILLPGHQERFAFADACETHHSWVHLAALDLPPALHQRLVTLPWPLPLSSTMIALMQRLFDTRRANLPTAPELYKAIATEMLWQYIGEGEQLYTSHIHHHQPPALEHARHFIAEHLREPLTLTEIASSAAVSPAHLIRLCRTHLGCTPIAYLWQQRVAHGIELLQQTGLSIGEIAEACGFQTSYHFSRRVKAATGLSPRTVREQAWRQ